MFIYKHAIRKAMVDMEIRCGKRTSGDGGGILNKGNVSYENVSSVCGTLLIVIFIDSFQITIKKNST